MESSDSREPSYYEVALTNRQVLIAFVALLTCMVAAFFAGVWIGRGAPAGGAGPAVAARATPGPPASATPEIDQLSFFSGAEAGSRTTATPAAPPARRQPSPTPEPTRPAATAAPAPAPTPTPRPAPTRAATAAPAATAAATGTVFVQVYSSTNGARAREIAADLRKAGFPVVLAESPSGARLNYRVRVGPFATRDQAEAAAVKLRREHRLDTWVTETP